MSTLVNRREYLKSLVGFVGVLSAAGCFGQNPSYNERLDTTLEAIKNAEEELQAEADKFNSERLESGGVEIQTAAISDHLDTAEEQLNAAESSANQDQRDDIQAIKNWIVLLREFTEFLDIFAEGFSQASSGFAYIQSEQFPDAVNELNTAKETFGTSRTPLRELC